jgi:hypothetical protein
MALMRCTGQIIGQTGLWNSAPLTSSVLFGCLLSAVWYSPQCCLALSAVPTSSEHGTFDTDNADATMHGPYMDKRAMPPQKKQILPKHKTKVAACKKYSLIRSTCVFPCGQ